MMPEFEKLKRYDICNLLDEGLLKYEMVEKDDGEYVKAEDAKKAFALHKDYCENINSSYYEDWKKMFESYVPVKEENERLKEENAYLRRLSLHALSGWAMGLSIVNALHENGTKKRQIAYFIKHRNFENMYRKEKDKWRKSK